MTASAEDIHRMAATSDFSGVVRIDRGGEVELEAAYGLADRRYEIANTVETQFGVASGTKGLTALMVVSLIADGTLMLDTPARALLGDDLPLVADDVTVAHLLAHRSGIGDYLDEDDEDLDLHADGWRTNVLHLPVVGSGDGGIFTTVADVHALWRALRDSAVVPPAWVQEMVRPRSDVPSNRARYGLGLWLHPTGPALGLEGADAGVSFRSVHDPAADVTHTVIANTTDGAWPLARLLSDELA